MIVTYITQVFGDVVGLWPFVILAQACNPGQ